MMPEPERERNFTIKVGVSYFNPSEQRFKDVYSTGMMYTGEIAIEIWKDISLWISAGYFGKKGELFFTKEETKLIIIPFGGGVRYIFFKNKINLYTGIGLSYYQLKETNPLGEVSKGGLGYTGEIGAFVLLGEGLIIDIKMDYSYCKMTPVNRSINVGGFEIGAGIGYRF